jgi:hypothetical protein
MQQMNAPAIDFPSLVLTDKANKAAYVYCAATHRELEACPLHTYLRTGRLQGVHRFDSRGRCFEGRATGQWRIDRALIREVGPITWLIGVILSGLNIVLRFDMAWQEIPSQSLESVKREVKDYLRRDPRPYIRNRPLQTVLGRVTKATTFEQLCHAIEP